MKQKTISQLKKVAWDLFSKYIRARNADYRGYARCVTCGVIKHWKELQAGHFIPGRHNSNLFDERGCHAQCYHCNIGLKSNPREYDRFMREKYGGKTIIELEKQDKQSVQFTRQELTDKAAYYKQKFEELNVA